MQKIDAAKAAINVWLDAPIPRRQALTAINLATLSQAITFASASISLRAARRMRVRDMRVINILTETNEFLMDKADGATLVELNKKLDFWRQMLDMPPRLEVVVGPNGHMLDCDGTCPLLTSDPPQHECVVRARRLEES